MGAVWNYGYDNPGGGQHRPFDVLFDAVEGAAFLYATRPDSLCRKAWVWSSSTAILPGAAG